MRPTPGCLARQLIENLKLSSLELEVHRRVCLEGEELEAYRQKEREERAAKEQAEKWGEWGLLAGVKTHEGVQR